MIHPIRALQRFAFKFYSGYFETVAAERLEAMNRHPSARGEM